MAVSPKKTSSRKRLADQEWPLFPWVIVARRNAQLRTAGRRDTRTRPVADAQDEPLPRSFPTDIGHALHFKLKSIPPLAASRFDRNQMVGVFSASASVPKAVPSNIFSMSETRFEFLAMAVAIIAIVVVV